MNETGRRCVEVVEREWMHRRVQVLDESCWIMLVDYMGDDTTVVEAARVSYGRGTRKVRDDAGLIRYLIRNEHMSPFEMCEARFVVSAPIFVARQWFRHRTANVNEMSLRYSEAEETYYVPHPDDIRGQDSVNRQGRGDPVANPEGAEYVFLRSCADSMRDYRTLVKEFGVARELSRIVLPLATITRFHWKIDLRNLLHFIRLRMDHHAQKEIRAYAEVLWSFVQDWVPVTAEAWKEYVLDSVRLSPRQLAALIEMAKGGDPEGLGRSEKAELQALLERLPPMPR